MRAAVNTRYGPPEVVRVTDVPSPTPGDGELLVKVYATTVNRTDIGFRAAKPFFSRAFTGLVRPKVTIQGSEFAGLVEALGPGVSTFAVGDRVFGFTGSRFGAHAEYLTIGQDEALARMPAGWTYEQAAPSTEGGLYAHTHILTAGVQPGQAVLVHGATGAIGSAAVQLLADLGARVTATADTEHLELVEGLGAERVIDWTATDFTRDGQTYDAVIDAVGKSGFTRCRRLLKPHGVYVSSDAGPYWQNVFLLPVTPLFRGRTIRFRPPRPDQALIRHLGDLMAAGRYRPLIDRRYPLADIVDAYRYVQQGRKVGGVVITVAAEAPAQDAV